MYEAFFGFDESPFSIAPDPRYLYMSERHQEALAHLLYGLQREGGFILLTGEVGTGKTTICRKFLQNVPENTDLAFVLYPKLSAMELLATTCEELGIACPAETTIKFLVDCIYKHLLAAHAQGRHTALIIDEAQNLTTEVLEQLRLLTNLETDKKKLLQIILLGQPELHELLNRPELRQLSQRITARYHLGPLAAAEVEAYISFRLGVAGCKRSLFSASQIRRLHKASQGIPRLINLICDRALLGAYSAGEQEISSRVVSQAIKEVGGQTATASVWRRPGLALSSGLLVTLLGLGLGIAYLTDADQTFDRAFLGDGPLAIFSDQPAQTTQAGAGADTGQGVLQSTPSVSNAKNDPVAADGAAMSAEGAFMSAEGSPNMPAEGSFMSAEGSFMSAEGSSMPAEGSSMSAEGSSMSAEGSVYGPFEQYELDKNNLGEAWDSLFSLWRITGDSTLRTDAGFCNRAAQRGLECLHRRGNWRGLLQLNRPAVLSLMNEQGVGFRVALTDVSENQLATIELDGQQHQLPLATLDAYWYGQYSLIWRVPPYQSRFIRPGTIQDRTEWLQAQLDLRDSLLANGDSRTNAASLRERVREFQQEAGIQPDGIAGTITIIMLNSWTQPETPLLLARDKAITPVNSAAIQ